MYGPDVEAAGSMPVMLPAGSSGWFGRNTPGNDDATPISIDFLNHVRGELKNIVEAFGYTEDKTLVNQIATALVEYVLTNGRYQNSLYVAKEPGSSTYRTRFTTQSIGEGVVWGRIITDVLTARQGVNVGDPLISVIDLDANGFFANLETTGDLTVKSKIKNVDGADVVFDDGITAEGKATAADGFVTDAGTVDAAWKSAHTWVCTLNKPAGKVTVKFDAGHPLAPMGVSIYETIVLTNDCIAATSRVYAAVSYSHLSVNAKIPQIINILPASGSVAITLINIGTANIENDVVVSFDVMNPA